MNKSNSFHQTRNVVVHFTLFDEETIHRFQQGDLHDAYDYFGSHICEVNQQKGFYFSVWAPNAKLVGVVGDFNQWNSHQHILFPRLDQSGIWEGFIPAMQQGCLYKFYIVGQNDISYFKADPYARFAELRPANASITWCTNYKWKDRMWMRSRKKNNSLQAPWNVYELHVGSWMRPLHQHGFHSYRAIASLLIPYLLEMGFTHVELMPVMEFPYDKSWGYQCTGYFAATSRYGTPDDLMFLIDELHKNKIGVILDWVPSHFPRDEHGLYFFDGAHTYEYADMRKGFHPDWNSYIFNYKRGEVQSFLISSAHFWMKYFHADALRVDAVNSMVRLDFSRKKGTWIPNEKGTNENLEAILFLKKLNQRLYNDFPDTQTIAEDASDWKGVTTPVNFGGLGFGMKWMMGWMHDTFRYFKASHTKRLHIQDTFTFSLMYFYHENFMLPFSHDEVVHGKSPMIYKMPGSEYEKFANVRLLYAYMYLHPGAKLLFMGNEFGQTTEWDENKELDWHLLQHDSHKKLKQCVAFLSHFYRNHPVLYKDQFEPKNFEWTMIDKKSDGVVAFKRKGRFSRDDIQVILNLSHKNYTNWGMEIKGKLQWKEVFNSNDLVYWGSGTHQNSEIPIKILEKKKKICEINLQIPALSALILQ